MNFILAAVLLLQSAPQYQWVKAGEVGRTAKAGDPPLVINLPASAAGKRVKIELLADLGVTFWFGTRTNSGTVDPRTKSCFGNRVFKTSFVCLVPNTATSLVIQDERKAGSVIAGVLGKGNAATSTLAAENKINLVLYRAQCIANCP